MSIPIALSLFRGSGTSHLEHWNVCCPLPPGVSVKVRRAPLAGLRVTGFAPRVAPDRWRFLVVDALEQLFSLLLAG